MSGQDFAAEVARITSSQGGHGAGSIDCTLFKCKEGLNILEVLASIGLSGDPHVGVGATGQMSSPSFNSAPDISSGGRTADV